MPRRPKLARKYRAKHRKRASRALKRNPSTGSGGGGGIGSWLSFPAVDWAETAKMVGAGAAGFGISRLATRIVAVQTAKRKPTWAKHTGVLANVLTFAAALLYSRKWSKTRPYEMPLVIGTGAALVQTVLQTYFPKLAWIVSDATPDQIAEAAGLTQQVGPQPTSGYLPPDDDEDDDEDADAVASTWGSHNDAYDQGRFARSAQPENQPRHAAPPRPVDPNGGNTGVHQEGGGMDHDEIDDMLSELDSADTYPN